MVQFVESWADLGLEMWRYYWLYKSSKSLWLLTGTSTDVSRYAGSYEHVFETTTAGVTIQAPQVIFDSTH